MEKGTIGIDPDRKEWRDRGRTVIYRNGKLVAAYKVRPSDRFKMDEEVQRYAQYYGASILTEKGYEAAAEDAEVISIETVNKNYFDGQELAR